MKIVSPVIQGLGPHCLYKLYCFYFVVHFGSYHRAADYLHLSPSAVSKMIQALEGRLNLSLLHRKTRSPLQLSAAGAQVYAFSQQLVESFEALEQSLGHTPQPKIITVCLDLPEWIWCDYFLDALQQFRVDHPECPLQLKTGIAESRSLNQSEVWIGTDPQHGSERIAKHLWLLKPALYASPAYVEAHPPIQCINDLKQHRGIYWQGEDPRLLEVLNWHQPFTQHALEQELKLYSSSALMKLVQMGLGLISWFHDHPALERSALVELGHCLVEQSPCVPLYFSCTASLWMEPCIQSLYRMLQHSVSIKGEKKS